VVNLSGEGTEVERGDASERAATATPDGGVFGDATDAVVNYHCSYVRSNCVHFEKSAIADGRQDKNEAACH
jgi:hypothetical protein